MMARFDREIGSIGQKDNSQFQQHIHEAAKNIGYNIVATAVVAAGIKAYKDLSSENSEIETGIDNSLSWLASIWAARDYSTLYEHLDRDFCIRLLRALELMTSADELKSSNTHPTETKSKMGLRFIHLRKIMGTSLVLERNSACSVISAGLVTSGIRVSINSFERNIRSTFQYQPERMAAFERVPAYWTWPVYLSQSDEQWLIHALLSGIKQVPES